MPKAIADELKEVASALTAAAERLRGLTYRVGATERGAADYEYERKRRAEYQREYRARRSR